jgi:hypothetical protein
MIQILLIAAAMLLSPASLENVRAHSAQAQPGGAVAPGTARAGPPVAQNATASTLLATADR